MLKILITDDEESIVNVLSISLKGDGYDVVTAYSGRECLEKFVQESPDIVITDMKMPGIDGLEVLERIKNLNTDTEVIIITGHGDMDSAIEALHRGASDFINKPIKDEALSIALERAKEKLTIRQRIREYTDDLENMVRIATEEVGRKSEFQTKLITSSNDGIVATDDEGEIVIFNPAAERIFGYLRSEVIRKMSISDLYLKEVSEEFEEGLEEHKTIVKRLPWKEIEIVAKNGEKVPTRFSGTVLYKNGEMMGSVAFFQDMRELKHLEEELVRSERLAAIGQTVTGLAHYIKNILTGLKGGAYVVNIGLDKNDTDRLRTGWNMIEKNIGRISELVLDLLTYSREHEPEYQSCLPNEIVSDVCELMEAKAAERDIDIKMDFDPSIGEVSMDPETIHRTILNLVSNAIDACIFDEDTNKRWQVHIKTLLDDDKMIRFEVKDNGSGMTEEIKEKLFSSFFSTKRGKGTGLGLLVTKKLIDEHGGRIDVTSHPGKGTTFTIILPYLAINKAEEVTANEQDSIKE